ncbi:IS110 family transposase [Paenibacillus sp. LPE1-1-1.1]|uniref:IS110 family transposase n=1 Tax=Paenibacillus sp. LPE1-1-1.1 TaxID=3135230 RepID=UPI00343149E8
MKFKQSDAQNQRIERMTTSHLVVGIDMAKETHVAQATNFQGIVVSNRHLSFSNSIEGFEKLNRWMTELQQKHRIKKLIIGMEPTGHYWFNLANWLADKELHVVMVNPATTKRNKENRDNSPSKNDPKDALVIADSVSLGFYYEYTRQSVVFQRLRTIMSDREFWVSNSVRLQNRIIRWLDIRFPEYPSVFKDWTCKRLLATLKTFPCPQDLETYAIPDVISAWRTHMQRAGGSTGMKKAAQLIAHAKRSVGDRTAVEESKADLIRLIEEYERVTTMLEQIEKDIESLLSEIPMAQQLRILRTYPGDHFIREHVTYCRRCIRKGYHSILHQFTLIHQCPFHPKSKLYDYCPKCLKLIPYRLSDDCTGFQCKCGNRLYDELLSFKRWREHKPKISSPLVNRWIQLDENERAELKSFIFIRELDLDKVPNLMEYLISSLENNTPLVNVKRHIIKTHSNLYKQK